MTIDQTRQLAVEFERRIQTIDPTAASVGKLDTDTIYAYLNQYQYVYIKQAYMQVDQLTDGSRGVRRVSDMMKTLITSKVIQPAEQSDSLITMFHLPDDYFMYIRSESRVSGTYKGLDKLAITANDFIKQDDVALVLNTFYNSDGIIRKPLVILESTTNGSSVMEVIHDKYTKIHDAVLTYYRRPVEFNIIDNAACELPYDCFEDLVSGAVELYFNYKYKVSLADAAARAARRRKQLQPEEEGASS